jgi:hypothetical protein
MFRNSVIPITIELDEDMIDWMVQSLFNGVANEGNCWGEWRERRGVVRRVTIYWKT